jgi:hypothetical protein
LFVRAIHRVIGHDPGCVTRLSLGTDTGVGAPQTGTGDQAATSD